jgi:hypothetical protein
MPGAVGVRPVGVRNVAAVDGRVDKAGDEMLPVPGGELPCLERFAPLAVVDEAGGGVQFVHQSGDGAVEGRSVARPVVGPGVDDVDGVAAGVAG